MNKFNIGDKVYYRMELYEVVGLYQVSNEYDYNCIHCNGLTITFNEKSLISEKDYLASQSNPPTSRLHLFKIGEKAHSKIYPKQLLTISQVDYHLELVTLNVNHNFIPHSLDDILTDDEYNNLLKNTTQVNIGNIPINPFILPQALTRVGMGFEGAGKMEILEYYSDSESKAPHTCTMKEYVGLNERYRYCTTCDKKVFEE